jgi:hypothetical protein
MASAAFRVTAHMSTCSDSRVGACNLEALDEMLAMAAATAASDVEVNGPSVHAMPCWPHMHVMRGAVLAARGVCLMGEIYWQGFLTSREKSVV